MTGSARLQASTTGEVSLVPRDRTAARRVLLWSSHASAPVRQTETQAPHELHFSVSSSSHGDVTIAPAGQTSRHERHELLRYLVATHSGGVTSGRRVVEGTQTGVDELEAVHRPSVLASARRAPRRGVD